MVARGRVQNGVVVLDNGVRLPEGQEVTVLTSDTVPTHAGLEGSRPHSVLDIPTVSVGGVASPADGRRRPARRNAGRPGVIHGLDTGFLVAAQVTEHAEHAAARATLARLLAAGDLIAIAPQMLAEFIHVVTDPRRFAQPLDMTTARQLAEQWWTARKSCACSPMTPRPASFFAWLHQFSLGRERLLDTLLAATYRQVGIQSLLTTNQVKGPKAVKSGAAELVPAAHQVRSHAATLR